MKLSNREDIQKYQQALISGGLRGSLYGMAISAVGVFYLKRRTSVFKFAGGYHRVLLYVAPGVFTGVVGMEEASRRFEADMRTKQHGDLAGKKVENVKVSTFTDQWKDWVFENKYKLIVAGWAASMGGSFWFVNRDKYMTKSQKIVQARVYAQGLTVVMLLASVILSSAVPPSDKEKKDTAARSWERDLNYVNNANHPKVSTEEFERENEKELDNANAA